MTDIERMAEAIQDHIRVHKRVAAAERRAYPDIHSIHARYDGALYMARTLHRELWQIRHDRIAWSSRGRLREWWRDYCRRALVARADELVRQGAPIASVRQTP